MVRRDGQISHHHPAEHVFWRSNANSLEKSDGTFDNGLESMLGRIENTVARATREPIARMEPLDRDQRDALDMFFSAMLFRVPSSQAALASGFEAQARIVRETHLAYQRPVPPESALLAKNGPALFTLVALEETSRIVEQMTHTLLVAPDGETFVTSDRAATIHAELGFPGLGNRFCEASLPLSPRVLLRLWWGGLSASGYSPTSPQIVLEMNRRTVACCDQWFICNRRNFDSRWIPTQ